MNGTNAVTSVANAWAMLNSRLIVLNDYYCITPGYITAYGGQMNGTIVEANCCNSAYDSTMANAFLGDGAAAYTLQGLWTMAREGLDVVVVIFANHAYRILNIELSRTRAGAAGPQARRLLDLGDPSMDWVSLAKGFGVPGVRASDAESFDAALARGFAGEGPMLIEAALG